MRIKDIAKLANVSPATVSFVLNGKPGVSEETRKRVLSIVQETGYTINSNNAKNDQQNPGNIRFLKYRKYGPLVDENGGFISTVIDGMVHEAGALGYNIVMTTVNRENCNEVIQTVKNEPCEGLILLGTELDSSDISFLQGINVPVVIIDNLFEFDRYDCVVMNNAEGAYKAVKHLVELGYTDIGYFHSSIEINNFMARAEGFNKALKAFNIEAKPENIFYLEPTVEGACRDMKKVLEKNRRLPKAVFSDNDTIALGAVNALKQFNIKIPQDLSIIGFDDIPFCYMVDPPLSTLHIYKEQIGALAVRRIADKIKNNDKTVIKIQIGAELVVRGSTSTSI